MLAYHPGVSPAPIPLDAVGALVANAAEAAGIGVLLLSVQDGQPRTLFVNEVVSRWVGLSPQTLLSRPSFECIAPEHREVMARRFADRAQDPDLPTSLECTVVSVNNERIPVSVGIARGEVDGQVVQIVLLTDMRDRKAVDAKLSASERRFRDLIQAAPDGVVISHRLGIKFANRAAETMLGVSSGSLVGRSMNEFLPPEEIERMQTRLRTIAGGEHMGPAVYRAVRPDGSEVLAEIASIMTEHEGQPAVLAIARDVTDREALKATLERTERLAALGRLSAGMAHEINNPLAFVSLSAEALARRIESLGTDATREEIRALLDNISRGTARVSAIVRDLKDFSRDGDADRGPSDLAQVLDSAIRMVQHEIAPRARLVRDIPKLPLVVGAARKLEQVFVNLLMNAMQALPDGRTGEIVVRASSDETSALVSIHDDGAGIARAHLDRVFDPFFTTKPVGVGTGLGLSICHGIVMATGGSISIDSEEGRGTTVNVRLVRAAGRRHVGPDTVVRASIPPVHRARVLVIEDQGPLARTLAKALADRYEVTLAASVGEAIAAIDRHGEVFDAVLCDMLMPDGTGIDVFEHASRRYPELGPRFAFMTGGAFLPSVVQFLEQTPNARIDKPFGLPAIEELLDRVIASRARGGVRIASDTATS